MRKFFAFSVVFIWLCIAISAFADGSSGSRFRYPLPQISDPSCRFSPWSSLDSDCKIELPRIEWADYAKYKDNFLYERIYTVLWEGTYDYGWDAWQWSHEGVDIATSLGTPVVAIGDGEVLVAGWQSGWGNVVSIKHALDDGSNIYSNYAHLSSVSVKVGDTVHGGDSIGAVGSTGNSTGNHLHFQIDTKKWLHPWYYSACAKGISPMDVVNKGLCQSDLEANTIDPIAFLESGRIAAPVISNETIEQIQQENTTEISQEDVRSREEILRQELEMFVKKYDIKVVMSVDKKNVAVGTKKTAKITVIERRNKKPFTGMLPLDGIELHTADDGIRLFPTRIIDIQKGEREFSMEGKKPGKYLISLRIGTEILSVTTLSVYDPKVEAKPTQGVFFLPKNPTLGDERTVGFVMRTSLGGYSLGIPYGDAYILRAKTGKAKFCNVSNKIRKTCTTGDLVSSLQFSYADTYRGVLLARAVSLGTGDLVYELVRVSDGKIMATSASMKVGLPKDINTAKTYRNEVLIALERGLFRTNQWKLLPDWQLKGKQAKEIIENALGYAYLKAWDNGGLKKKILELRTQWGGGKGKIGDYDTVSRAQLARLMMDAFNDPRDTQATGTKWRDESGSYELEIRTLRVRDGFLWRDSFAGKYFQSDKVINIEESLYFANFYLDSALVRFGLLQK